MLDTRTVSVTVNISADEAYHFLREPMNLAAWAKSFCLSVACRQDVWFVETGHGKARVQFAEDNPYRVADYELTLATGEKMVHPMRVIANGERRCEVVATLFRPSDVSDEDFLLDGSLLVNDLRRLKETVELMVGQL
ncbi:hypothetical protein [Halobacillus campisalis]|uniref:Polyketide cyclase n=1 Tax=Halobacillus campisalis TaxID=435909 RepID=A0ABW2K102_9BACI|nr:hypothetical protein [Halobacillus campisalis]